MNQKRDNDKKIKKINTNNIDKHITNFKKSNYEKIVDIVEGNKSIEPPVKKV